MRIFKDFFSSLTGPSAEPHEPQPATRPATQRIIQGQNMVVVLILGRSGSGKSSFIDAVCSSNTSGITPQYRSTTGVTSHRAQISETKFKLIDTPGFDNVELSDVEVCTRIARYFWDPNRYNLGVNGIIYIHQAGDSLRSKSLRRYLTVLSKAFLGKSGMRRLTIFIPRIDTQGLDTARINQELQDNGSILSEASAMGAKIVSTTAEELEAFTNVVRVYRSTEPILLPVQDYNPNIIPELEAILYEKPTHQPSSNQETRLRNYQRRLEELQSTLDTKESQALRYREAYHQLKTLHANQQDTEASLRQQVQQIQREYASLRSELQLQENSEQSEIVQELEDLNRYIDDISRSVSAYLTDNHIHTFEKDPAEVTALDARDRSGLFKVLRHEEGKCSLISSERGEGLEMENFLDFTIRDMLCTLLVTAIFQPFHPAIDTEYSDFLLRAYEDIQRREPQIRSGKWRSSTFKSIYNHSNPDQVATWIDDLLHRFALARLNPLMTYVFGGKNATMDTKHFNQMHELVTKAWNWNAKLKGEVVVLGDFRQTMHAPYSKFDAKEMKDFEPRPNTQPKTVLGTVGLGLISLRAVGGGQPPEETLVCKTIVTTDTLYSAAFSD